MKAKLLVAELCLTLCNPMDYSQWNFPGKKLEWDAIPFSRGSSRPRDQTWVSCIAGRFFTICATKKALSKWKEGIWVYA